jgi:hypothetical protein
MACSQSGRFSQWSHCRWSSSSNSSMWKHQWSRCRCAVLAMISWFPWGMHLGRLHVPIWHSEKCMRYAFWLRERVHCVPLLPTLNVGITKKTYDANSSTRIVRTLSKTDLSSPKVILNVIILTDNSIVSFTSRNCGFSNKKRVLTLTLLTPTRSDSWKFVYTYNKSNNDLKILNALSCWNSIKRSWYQNERTSSRQR